MLWWTVQSWPTTKKMYKVDVKTLIDRIKKAKLTLLSGYRMFRLMKACAFSCKLRWRLKMSTLTPFVQLFIIFWKTLWPHVAKIINQMFFSVLQNIWCSEHYWHCGKGCNGNLRHRNPKLSPWESAQDWGVSCIIFRERKITTKKTYSRKQVKM